MQLFIPISVPIWQEGTKQRGLRESIAFSFTINAENFTITEIYRKFGVSARIEKFKICLLAFSPLLNAKIRHKRTVCACWSYIGFP